ncbi:MAG: GNAT family N-acetyltransferase [Phycisphaeraceae bacterium]|nr:GNAT family N-acetyltransferase [Phycisphaeraceae bacterium]
MANARIDIVGPAEYALIASLYNQVFRPAKEPGFFERRFRARYQPLILVAHLDDRPVGFFLGFELKPSVFFAWLYGVVPDYRRTGIAAQLMEAAHDWAREHGYSSIRMECYNHHRPMLRMMVARGYNIVGIRWDPDHSDNLILFERDLSE